MSLRTTIRVKNKKLVREQVYNDQEKLLTMLEAKLRDYDWLIDKSCCVYIQLLMIKLDRMKMKMKKKKIQRRTKKREEEEHIDLESE